jgi:hypothetical protein
VRALWKIETPTVLTVVALAASTGREGCVRLLRYGMVGPALTPAQARPKNLGPSCACYSVVIAERPTQAEG